MFLYFVPTPASCLQPGEIPAAIAHAFSGLPRQAVVLNSPAKRGGLILADKSDTGRLGYYPAEQQWRPIPGSDFWVGRDLSRPLPTALALARPQQLPGSAVSDEAGQAWHIPYAMNYWEDADGSYWPTTHLPRRLALQADGSWTLSAVLPAYEKLWELTQGYCQALADAVVAAAQKEGAADDQQTITFSFDQIDELALEALRINYRLGAVELDWLGIYNLDFRSALVQVVRGMPLLAALKKKRALAGGGSSQPAAASMPASLPDSPAANGTITPPAITTDY